MGTFFSVKIVKGDYTDDKLRGIRGAVDNLLEEVNDRMSVFKPDSEISRFNQYRNTDWFEMSFDTVQVISQSISVSEMSGGAFDITISPLVNLWGFGSKGKNFIIPADTKVKELLNIVGYKNISVKFSPPSVKKNIAEIECNLSAIAKGFGVDKIAQYLDEQGITSYLVEIGGEIRVKGKNHQNRMWRIGIASPEDKLGIHRIIALKDNSMATSGDYRNYFQKNGIRYSHTIDPRTGKPINHKLVSVTVIHSSCMIADAIATAIDVMGPEQGYDLAANEKFAAFLIIKGERGIVEKMTPQFREFIQK